MATLPFRRLVTSAAVAFASLWATSLAAQAQSASAQAPGFSKLLGTVTDSVHNLPLAKALVLIEGASTSVATDDEGRFVVDSIPEGPHRVLLLHPLLDTLGMSMRTPPYMFHAGQTHTLDLAVPSGPNLSEWACTKAQRARGAAVMLGFVRDPDTKRAATGAKVSLVYEVSDSTGKKRPTVREAVVDSSGYYRICGLPEGMQGKVQVFQHGVSSGEVPVAEHDLLVLRAFSISSTPGVVAKVTDDSGKVMTVFKGNARVTGKVVDKLGRPIANARVTLQGGGATAVTRENGNFTLDSLPSGTQALSIRKLGYAPTETAVELSANEPASATVQLSDFVPTLEVMRVEAAQDKALAEVGFLSRKQTGMGYFLDGDRINQRALSFSETVRTVPGLRLTPLGDGRSNYISDTRGGCVTYYVDGTQWRTMAAGDIDEYVRPSELVAIEVYRNSQAPPQFTPPGQSGCTTIVAWTVAKVRPRNDDNSSRRP